MLPIFAYTLDELIFSFTLFGRIDIVAVWMRVCEQLCTNWLLCAQLQDFLMSKSKSFHLDFHNADGCQS